MEGDLGIVRAGLHAEVAARAGRVELVAGQRGQRAQAGGPAILEPEALEDARPEADGDREPPCAEADGLAGVGGRHLGRALDGAVGSPAVIRRAASVHARSSSRRSAGRSEVRSNAPNTSRACAGVATPA